MSVVYILKPSSACNFDCSFCSAKNLNIPAHEHVPQSLKEYLIKNKVDRLSVTGGEPLMNSQTYFTELLEILDEINGCCHPYEMSLTSNMVLWYNNPEKYDYLFKHPHVSVDTSFQYGGERKDDQDFTEERFVNIFNAFKDRYGVALSFVYVVNENNEQYVLKACELAKRLGTKVSFSPQLPLGASSICYPKYKILDVYMKIKDAGYEDYVFNLNFLYEKQCPFVNDPQQCLTYNKAIYVGEDEQVHESGICDNLIATKEPIDITEPPLFNKCYGCKLFRLCNGCPISTRYTKAIKDEHCKWMKENEERLRQHGFIKGEY